MQSQEKRTAIEDRRSIYSRGIENQSWGMPQGWGFDAGEPEMPTFNGGAAFSGVKMSRDSPEKKVVKRAWKRPWKKEKQLMGERIITLKNPLMNAEYVSNFVSPSRYNPITFPPKFFSGTYLIDLTSLIADIPQNDSRSARISSSYSPHAFSQFLVFLLQIVGPPSLL